MTNLLARGLTALLLASLALGTARAADPIKIGVISARSGVFALFGTSGERGFILAAEEINAKGGVLGRPLELITTDNKSRPEEASRLFRELIARGATIIVGAIGSGESAAANTLAKENKVPFFTVLGYSRFLTEEAGHRYFFRLITNSRGFYGPMVEQLIKEKYKRYCTIASDFAFGRDLVKSVMEDLKAADPSIEVLPGCEFWVPLATTDFATYMTAIMSKRPDIVMFGGVVGPSGRAFVAQAKSFGLFKVTRGAHPAMGEPANNAGLTKADIPENIITGTFFPYPVLNRPETQAFFKAYTKRWNELPMSEGAHAYATMHFVAKAFEKAGKVDREAFIDATAGLSVMHPSMGMLTMRALDNQSNAGAWRGYLAWDEKNNRPGMRDVEYIPGDRFLPSEAEIRKLRK